MALTSKLLAPFIGASIMASEEGYDDVAEQCILELSNEQVNILADYVLQD